MAKSKKAGYQTLVVGVSAARRPLHANMTALAKRLGCRVSDLVWFAVGKMLEAPPTIAPEGARSRTGTAPGFWVVPKTDDAGRAVSMAIVEVERRAEILDGHTFHRHTSGDSKGRARALNQAIRAATYNCQLCGLDAACIEVDEFESDAPE